MKSHNEAISRNVQIIQPMPILLSTHDMSKHEQENLTSLVKLTIMLTNKIKH